MVFQNGNKASYTLWKLDCPIYFIRSEIKPKTLWGLWYLVSSTEKKIITKDKYQINQFLCWRSYWKGQLNVSFVWLNPETCSGHKKAPGCHLLQLQTRCKSSTEDPLRWQLTKSYLTHCQVHILIHRKNCSTCESCPNG